MKPTNIAADRASAQLTIVWDEGHVTTLPFTLLSDACPCELCETERRNDDPLKILRAHSYALEAINPVGNYAINIMWKGGCHYGIYSWDYLQKLESLAAQANSATPTDSAA
jgi:DUF971 family protein